MTSTAAAATESPAPGGSGVPRRYGALLLWAITLLGVQGVVPPGAVQQILVALLAGGCLLLAIRAAGLSPALLRGGFAIAVVVLALSLLRATVGGVSDGAARACVAALLALGPPAVAVGVYRDLQSTGHVQVQAISGVLSLYLLLGMAFAFLYGAIDRLGSGEFFASGADASVSHCLYFSFTTLTTVGYGDLVAGSDLGRTLAIFEALLGQIYLVTIVSLLVSNLGRPARVGARRAPE
jgi:hypothetical protein